PVGAKRVCASVSRRSLDPADKLSYNRVEIAYSAPSGVREKHRRGQSEIAGPAPCDCGSDCPSTGTHCVVYVVSTRVSGGTATEGWSAHSGGAVGVDGAAGAASGACPAPDEGAPDAPCGAGTAAT